MMIPRATAKIDSATVLPSAIKLAANWVSTIHTLTYEQLVLDQIRDQSNNDDVTAESISHVSMQRASVGLEDRTPLPKDSQDLRSV